MKLLCLRFKQCRRALNDLGVYSLVLGFLALLLITISSSLHQKSSTSFYQLIVLSVLCLIVHFYRSDKKFIYLHIKNPYLEIYLEYLVLFLPFSFSVLFTAHGYYFFIFQLLIVVISFITVSISKVNYFRLKSISRIINSSRFEYLSGIRQSFFFLIPLYSLAVTFSWFYVVPHVFLWLITVTFASFYNECEPLNVLRSNNKSPRQFLWHKIALHAKLLLPLYIPILIINTWFNRDFWFINILFLLLQLSLLIFAITLKYRSYQPNEKLYRNKIILSIVSLSAILPYLLPVPLLMSLVYFKTALKNLNHFL